MLFEFQENALNVTDTDLPFTLGPSMKKSHDIVSTKLKGFEEFRNSEELRGALNSITEFEFGPNEKSCVSLIVNASFPLEEDPPPLKSECS